MNEKMMEDGWQVLTGQSREPLVAASDGSPFLLHREGLLHWQTLTAQAAEAGFDVQIASAWRGFERQQTIWNGKAAGQRPVLDAQGNPVEPQSNMMVDVAQRYENQLRYQKLENDILKLQGQDEDFNEVAPTFAQTVLDMPQILEYENGANILYQIAKANYIQTILPQIVNELVEERAKDTAKKKSFQTRTSAGSSRADSGAKDIMSGIMAEAQRTAKLF